MRSRTPAPLLALCLSAAAFASPASAQTDIVGGMARSATGTGLAKGNSFAVTASVDLREIEARLDFTGQHTLSFYVYQSPVEFGTYTRVHVNSVTATGTGTPDWYSSGPISVPLTGGVHYILAVSWTGSVRYFFDLGPSQAVSFGWHTHGYPDGFHPLPQSFASLLDDSAIYHQRLTTVSAGSNLPSVTAVGTGCSGSSSRAPTLMASRVPAIGNAAFGLVIDQAPSFGQAWLFAAPALEPTPVPLGGGCLVYLEIASMVGIGPFPTSPVNTTFVPLPVPAQPGLAGLQLFFQAAVTDPGTALGFVVTNAVDVRVH